MWERHQFMDDHLKLTTHKNSLTIAMHHNRLLIFATENMDCIESKGTWTGLSPRAFQIRSISIYVPWYNIYNYLIVHRAYRYSSLLHIWVALDQVSAICPKYLLIFSSFDNAEIWFVFVLVNSATYPSARWRWLEVGNEADPLPFQT